MVANIGNYSTVKRKVNGNCSDFALVPTLEGKHSYI